MAHLGPQSGEVQSLLIIHDDETAVERRCFDLFRTHAASAHVFLSKLARKAVSVDKGLRTPRPHDIVRGRHVRLQTTYGRVCTRGRPHSAAQSWSIPLLLYLARAKASATVDVIVHHRVLVHMLHRTSYLQPLPMALFIRAGRQALLCCIFSWGEQLIKSSLKFHSSLCDPWESSALRWPTSLQSVTPC